MPLKFYSTRITTSHNLKSDRYGTSSSLPLRVCVCVCSSVKLHTLRSKGMPDPPTRNEFARDSTQMSGVLYICGPLCLASF